jgi:myo-inositol-1(or 4)-monophosphatase
VPRAHSIRRTGSTAINLAYLACGRLHAFWARRIACWDAAAGLLIAREAGAAVESFAAASPHVPLDDPAFLVASTPPLLAELRGVLGTAPATECTDHAGRAGCGP